MATYLVTGGAGFIGSHICEALLAEGHAVRVLDNLTTGKRENLPKNAELIEQDVTDLEAIRPSFQGIDGVFHLAAWPSVQASIDDPVQTTQINLHGTLHVMLAARDAGVKRIIYAGSASAYSEASALPITEDAPVEVVSPYALQKYVGEEWMRLASNLYGIQTVNLRFFNAYGPRMAEEGAYTTVIAIFLRERKAGKPLPIAGDGTQTRDFVHVEDIARANLLAMKSEKVGRGERINIGTGNRVSVNDVAAIIGGPTIHLPPRVEIKHSQADATRAKTLLGWEPQKEFRSSLLELKKLYGVE